MSSDLFLLRKEFQERMDTLEKENKEIKEGVVFLADYIATNFKIIQENHSKKSSIPLEKIAYTPPERFKMASVEEIDEILKKGDMKEPKTRNQSHGYKFTSIEIEWIKRQDSPDIAYKNFYKKFPNLRPYKSKSSIKSKWFELTRDNRIKGTRQLIGVS